MSALDEHPQVVLAHSWSAVIDSSRTVKELVEYPVNTAASQAPERLRSMLFDGWGDDEGGVIRMGVLRQTPLHASYHFADRTFTAEIALHGPFYMVPDWLYFRRQHAGQGGAQASIRKRCANMDPRRANRVRYPVARLYAEYVWGFAGAIRRAPLSPADRRECYGVLGALGSQPSRSGSRADPYPKRPAGQRASLGCSSRYVDRCAGSGPAEEALVIARGGGVGNDGREWGTT